MKIRLVPSDRPPGMVSTIRGRKQAPALERITFVVLVGCLVSAVLPDPVGPALAAAAVASVVTVPLLRVVWLVYRYRQEHDWRFFALGLGLLGVIATGGLLAALGVG